MGWVWNLRQALNYSTELRKLLNSGIIQYHTGTPTKSHKFDINFSQDTIILIINTMILILVKIL